MSEGLTSAVAQDEKDSRRTLEDIPGYTPIDKEVKEDSAKAFQLGTGWDGQQNHCCINDYQEVDVPQESILVEAERITQGKRNEEYGPPLENHGRTADLWNAYLRCRGILLSAGITPYDVCRLNQLQKISRDCHFRLRDTSVDIVGYERNIEMMETE